GPVLLLRPAPLDGRRRARGQYPAGGPERPEAVVGGAPEREPGRRTHRRAGPWPRNGRPASAGSRTRGGCESSSVCTNRRSDGVNPNTFIVGGGIASLACAAVLISDGRIPDSMKAEEPFAAQTCIGDPLVSLRRSWP